MSVKHYKNGQLTLIAGSGGGGGEESFTGTKAEVEQAIAAGQIKENWTVYITDDIEEVVGGASGNCGCKIEYVTQEQYDALPEDKLTNDIEYRITDSNPATPSAKNMAYDNDKSGIEAVNVQDAIDVVNESLTNEDNETFNFGIKDGVRGFFTDPSRADDSFIPFSQSLYVYNKGVKKVPYTVYANHQNSGTISENEDNITIRSSGNNVTLHWTIDITKYDYLILKWTGGRFDTYIGIGTNNANNEWSTTNSGIHIVDVSNKTGIKTIFLDAWDNETTASVSQIILV